jgi:hypothetical protein
MVAEIKAAVRMSPIIIAIAPYAGTTVRHRVQHNSTNNIESESEL